MEASKLNLEPRGLNFIVQYLIENQLPILVILNDHIKYNRDYCVWLTLVQIKMSGDESLKTNQKHSPCNEIISAHPDGLLAWHKFE